MKQLERDDLKLHSEAGGGTKGGGLPTRASAPLGKKGWSVNELGFDGRGKGRTGSGGPQGQIRRRRGKVKGQGSCTCELLLSGKRLENRIEQTKERGKRDRRGSEQQDCEAKSEEERKGGQCPTSSVSQKMGSNHHANFLYL